MNWSDAHISDVLVIGAGLAGERVAIEAAMNGNTVTILSLVPPRRSHSTAAQGGMQASLGNVAEGYGDNPDIHFEDTVKGSDWGCDQEVARIFCEQAPVAVRQLSQWGVPWSRVVPGKRTLPDGTDIEDLQEKAGLIAQRQFGGTAKWRTCFASDGTGHVLQYAMDSVVVKLGVTVHDRCEAISLIHNGETCHGAVVFDLRTGELRPYLAKATVIATGGYGRIFGTSTNAVINEGTGMAIAQDTGLVPLGNMEAVQFHPTGIVPANILVTEGCRGDGGYLLDKNLHRFMPDYEPVKKEIASRDVVSRWMLHHIRQGFGVDSPYGPHLWLDIRHLGPKRPAALQRPGAQPGAACRPAPPRHAPPGPVHLLRRPPAHRIPGQPLPGGLPPAGRRQLAQTHPGLLETRRPHARPPVRTGEHHRTAAGLPALRRNA